jgi:hypothetical protein
MKNCKVIILKAISINLILFQYLLLCLALLNFIYLCSGLILYASDKMWIIDDLGNLFKVIFCFWGASFVFKVVRFAVQNLTKPDTE